MMTKNLLKFFRRQFQTVISKDIIKPSSPTPPHLKTYNLSLFDQIAMNAYMPLVLFYKTLGQDPESLKISLSRTLTHYYPFAGTLAKVSPTHVDCNDAGVEFIDARNDSHLSDFLHHSVHEDLDQLFPDNRVWYNTNRNSTSTSTSTSMSPLAIQVNRFACGGVAVAASLSHKIGDASSFLNFMNHWATMARFENNAPQGLTNPHFISHQSRKLELPKHIPHRDLHGDYITRSFVFANTKLNNLKRKVEAMAMEAGHPITNITRVEILTWLLHKSFLAAADTFKRTGVCRPLNLRNNLVEVLPSTTVGNLYLMMEFPTRDRGDLEPNTFIHRLRKTKMEFGKIRDLETAIEMVGGICSESVILETLERLKDYYIYSNLYGLPMYEIDFGWGKPVKVRIGGAQKNVIVVMETGDGNGIEALVSLERDEMKMTQNDPELLAFCEVV